MCADGILNSKFSLAKIIDFTTWVGMMMNFKYFAGFIAMSPVNGLDETSLK